MSFRRSRAFTESSGLIEISALIALGLLVSLFTLSKTINREVKIKSITIEPQIISDIGPIVTTEPQTKPSLIKPMGMEETEEALFSDTPIEYVVPDFEYVPIPPIKFGGIGDVNEDEIIPYSSVQDPPKLISSERRKLIEAISENYPQLARMSDTQGTVKLNFVCSKEGVPTLIEIVKEEPKGLGFGAAAVMALRTIRFTPGYQNDKPVAVKMSLPIGFVLKK
ncbi:MAG: energy transducer TonB [Candidatus Delongbacteria bacterium]|nr:energy transducer TonB [Candidatus Delongbacteria bacterium]MCG2760755.1 energy transducer TonB [Candidatus Delongbacteria bacterium]